MISSKIPLCNSWSFGDGFCKREKLEITLGVKFYHLLTSSYPRGFWDENLPFLYTLYINLSILAPHVS
jgi:hypothetical protein